MTFSDAIILRLNTLCKSCGFNQNQLAKQVGVRQSTISDIMNGKTKNPSLITLHRIATGLNMTLSEFLDYPEMNETLFDDE